MLDHLKLEQVLLLDIETAPMVPTFAELPERLQQLWDKKTSTQRNDESPEAYYSLRGGILAEFGKVICVSVGKFTKQNDSYGLKIKSFSGHDEAELLKSLASMLNSQQKDILLCAHNGKEFDFPYLSRRMLINGIKLPHPLDIGGKKPWEVNHIDTLELWKFGDRKNFTSLDLLAAIFNIPTPKDDIDGSQVAKVYWEDKDLDRIVNYCRKDVLTLGQLLLKFKGLPLIREEDIQHL